ncbi:16S rRNA (guanine(966)-N(2))-methyltransferase RsmD [Gammaproteobacteria bacterium]|nr:16S rRNA (guanine(966)-N(2))-methyltransferase RsmD [Gammaproteobacteria bacterium]
MKKEKKGEIRIIGGKWKGKKIYFDLNDDLRPTPDRAKETLFNWLGQDLNKMHCLDLFSGTGALGFEAFSRGAEKVTFVEKNKEYLQKIKKIYLEMSEKADCDFFRAECLEWIQNNNSGIKYDLIFIDPPFNKNLIHDLLTAILEKELLSKNGQIYFEFEKKLDLEIPESLNLKKKKSLGKKSYVLAEVTCLSS